MHWCQQFDNATSQSAVFAKAWRYTSSTAAPCRHIALLICELRQQRTLRLPQRPRQPAGQVVALVDSPQGSHWRAALILVVHEHLQHASMPHAV